MSRVRVGPIGRVSVSVPAMLTICQQQIGSIHRDSTTLLFSIFFYTTFAIAHLDRKQGQSEIELEHGDKSIHNTPSPSRFWTTLLHIRYHPFL